MDLILLLQVISAEAGLIIYASSFFGYGLAEGGRYLLCILVCSFLASIPTVVRDRKFFVKNWGFGLRGLRSHFPFQFFPARRIGWLDPLAWSFMGVLFLHFFWLVIYRDSAQAPLTDTSADLRYTSLMATFSSVLGALVRAYPPTEMPPSAPSSTSRTCNDTNLRDQS